LVAEPLKTVAQIFQILSTPIIGSHIITIFWGKVYKGIMNKGKNSILGIDIFRFFDRIAFELHTSLIKSGGGNGPMKPGNLLLAWCQIRRQNER
jgi:hypothetical protein